MDKEDIYITIIIIIMIIVIVLVAYMNLRVSMNLANHYGLQGWDWWWYVLGNHRG